MPGRYFIGIDGGGSKTLVVLMDEDGCVLAHARAGGSSIIGPPSSHACEVLSSLKQRVCHDAGIAEEAITGIGLGLNGIDFVDEYPEQFTALHACLGIAPADFVLVNDGIVALWGASAARTAVIVHHGSGVTNAYRRNYGHEQLFDHLNVGRLFDLRTELPALVARMIDGRVAPTPLKTAALSHYGVPEDVYAELLYRNRIPGERMRTGAMVAFAAWLAADPAATQLVAQAAEDYAVTACAMISQTGDAACQVAFGGGVINHAPEAFMALLKKHVLAVYPAAGVIRPQLSPAHGAAVMSAFQHGLDPEALYARLLPGEGANTCK